MNNEVTKEKWQALSNTWYNAGPPATPSCDDISIYRQFISTTMRGRNVDSALLLGCTPSLRILMAQLGIAVTCVDINQSMITNTTSSLGDAVTKESFVCQDWLKMDLEGKQFPIIIGDKVFDNVPYENWAIFKDKILLHLSSTGSFIVRVAPQDTLLLGRTFSELLTKWTLLYSKQQLTLREAASGLWEQALGASAKIVPGRQTIDVFTAEIELLTKNFAQTSEHRKIVLDEFRQLFEHSIKHEWTSYTLGNVIDALNEELRLTAIGRAKDYEVAIRQPILHFVNH